MLMLARLLQGAFIGLAQMTLASTLIIDTCESFQRTEANYTAAWFSRFALSLGPVIALILFKWLNYRGVVIAGGCFALIPVLLISWVKFPFKAPSDNMKILSLDRFFLPQGFLLFLNTAAITTVVGLLFSIQHSVVFYTMLMGGFIIALLAEKFAFPNAELKSEVFSGVIFMLAAVLIFFTNHQSAIQFISPSLIGFGIGVIGSRFLLFISNWPNTVRGEPVRVHFPVLGIRNQSRTVFRIWILGKSQNCRTAKVLAQDTDRP